MNDHIERLWRRVLGVVRPGRVTLVDDGGAAQALQARFDSSTVQDSIPRLAEYGFQSVPPVGSDAIVLFLAGNASDGVIVATGNQTYRLRGLGDGDVAISDNRGRKVHLSAAGVTIDGGGATVSIVNAPVVSVSGDLHVAGNVSDSSGTMAAMRAAYNVHKHGSSPTPDHSM